jgi:hypothetical protein
MKPCKGCPFRRDTPAGDLGGSPTTTYVGQAHGPFWLPCHNSAGYGPETRRDPTHHQCAGAAIFRANTGRAELMPPALLHLPADTTEVFGSYAEFVAHHEEMSVEMAKTCLEILPPDRLMVCELSRQGAAPIKPAKAV